MKVNRQSNEYENTYLKWFSICGAVVLLWLIGLTYVQLNYEHSIEKVNASMQLVIENNEKMRYLIEEQPDTIVITINNNFIK